MSSIDFTTVTDEEWPDVWAAAIRENDRRSTMANAAWEATRLAEQYLDARDGTTPVEDAVTLADAAAWPAWVQPTGAHDCYPAGRVVSHGGKLWRSLNAANVWEPGGKGVPDGLWEEVTAADATSTGDDGSEGTTDTKAVPEWAEGTSYQVGDRVTYHGVVYECLQAHTPWAGSGWTPVAYPAGWKTA